MPILEFKCKEGHVTERLFKTITLGEEVDYVVCAQCAREAREAGVDFIPAYSNGVSWETATQWMAKKIVSIPLQAHLYGNPEGYEKPSPTKRFNTKTVSMYEGNDAACG